MNTTILPVIAFLAASAAYILLPVGAVAAAMTLTATGVLAIFLADYGRAMEPVKATAEIVEFEPQGRHGALRNAA